MPKEEGWKKKESGAGVIAEQRANRQQALMRKLLATYLRKEDIKDWRCRGRPIILSTCAQK